MKTFRTFIMLLTVLLFTVNTVHAQLEAGDIAFLGYNSDNPDGFAIIALVELHGNSEINFTDRGWQVDESFRPNEGTITWTTPADGISFGSVVQFYDDNGWETSTGSVSGNITLVESGDQIIAFTGEDTSPNFLAAIHYNGGAWDSDAGDPNESALPVGLKNDSTALALPEEDNAVYIGTIAGSRSELLAHINNSDNWYHSSNTNVNLHPHNFPYNVFIASSEEWHNTTNWFTGNLPDNTTSVIIPENHKLMVTGSAECNSVFIAPRALLHVKSGHSFTVNGGVTIHSRSASYTGSMINEGTTTISGASVFERFIPGSDWHIISSPVAQQKRTDFAASNAIEFNETENNYDLAPYSEPDDNWLPYTAKTSEEELETGTGYAMRRTIDAREGVVQFTGHLNLSDVNISIVRNKYGWNCIGNPFPSEIQATGAGSFLRNNSNELDPDYAGLYLWDYTINDYEIWGNGSAKKMASGQGFIVKSKPGDGTIHFTTDIQANSAITFKRAGKNWPSVTLNATSEDDVNTTTFIFNENMTTGLDPTYDVGKLKGNPGFALYSEFMEDNGHDYAIQALPVEKLDSCRIPVGLDFEKGGEVTFSLKTEELPEEVEVMLEDAHDQNYHRLHPGNAQYSTTVAANNKGAGRFFLLLKNTRLTDTNSITKPDFSIVTKDKKVVVNIPNSKTTGISLYDITGKKQKSEFVRNQGLTTIDASDLPDGIYILQIKQTDYTQTSKVLLYQ